MAVKKFFLPILEDKNININIKKLDKEIQELENQRARIKDAYIKGIVKLNDFEADYKLIEDKLANLETQKLELINLETFNYSPHELLAKRDLENFAKTNYEEYKNLMGKRENLWKKYHRAKNEEQKSEILAEINSIQPVIKELRKYDKYCKDIKDRTESIQNNLNNFNKDIQKKTILGHYRLVLSF